MLKGAGEFSRVVLRYRYWKNPSRSERAYEAQPTHAGLISRTPSRLLALCRTVY